MLHHDRQMLHFSLHDRAGLLGERRACHIAAAGAI
jgi:hypothetical protein